MLPIIGPLVSAGANLLGGLLGNEAAAGQASAQRAWEQQMSSTSWQRGVADMRAAGINPMLAYMQGGASTPGGAMGGVPNPNLAGSAVSAWNDARMAQLQQSGQALQNLKVAQDTALSSAQTLKTNTDARAAAQDAGLELAPRDSMYWPRLMNLQAQRDMMVASASASSAQAANIRAVLPQSRWIGQNPRLSFLLGGGALPKLASTAAQLTMMAPK